MAALAAGGGGEGGDAAIVPPGYTTTTKVVPAAEHWQSFDSEPENFDADEVWTYTLKVTAFALK